MKKIIFPSLIALGMIACSENSESVVSQDNYTKRNDDSKALWACLRDEGVANYFEKNGILDTDVESSKANSKCDNGLRMDSNTIYMDEMEEIYREGKLVEGVCGNAVSLESGEVAPLSINLLDAIPAGTVEFWFKPGSDFFEEKARTLLGNDESRIHFFVKNKQIVFQKNHADIHYYVMGDVKFNDGWNKIAGQWGDGFISVWVNDTLIAKKAHAEGYQPSIRPVKYGNLLVAGYKSSCCMEGPGQYSAMTTSGAFDQVRISNIPRYKNEDLAVSSSSADTVKTFSSSSEEIIESSSSSVDSVKSSASFKLDTLITASSSSEEIIESSSSLAEDTLSIAPDIVDSNFTYFEDFEKDIDYGVELTDGEIGKAASLKWEDMVQLAALNDSIPQGTFEFSFKPDENFATLKNAALVGSDEGRLTILKINEELVFFKNLEDKVISVRGKFELKDGWNKIAGQWDGESISLYVNGEMINKTETNTGYSPSIRDTTKAPFGNSILVGYKSSCCTDDTQGNTYTFGNIDNILITTKLLY